MNDPYHLSSNDPSSRKLYGIITFTLFLVSGWLLQGLLSRPFFSPAVLSSLPSSRWNRFFHWWQTTSVRQIWWTVVILGLSYGLSMGQSELGVGIGAKPRSELRTQFWDRHLSPSHHHR